MGMIGKMRRISRAKVRHGYYKIRWRRSAPEPYELLSIDPSNVKYCHPSLIHDKYNLSRYGTHIAGGDWDLVKSNREIVSKRYVRNTNLIKYDNWGFYESVKEHFRNGKEWESTKLYNWATENLDSSTRYDNKKDVKKWLNNIDKLYQKMSCEGYKTQRELKNTTKYSSLVPPEINEAAINITRDGEYVLGGEGRHRITIAKILRMERIPVRVFARHRIWQTKRHSIAYGNKRELKEQETHPDLVNLIQ